MPFNLTKLSAPQMEVTMAESQSQKLKPLGYYDKYTKRKGHTGYTSTICVDGEGYSREDGEHIYTYIAAVDSSGENVHETRYAVEGLATEECFWFLVTLPRGYRKVGFSFNYDINMMLRDLSLRYLRLLKDRGYVKWKGWNIRWTRNKVFSVSRRAKDGSILKCVVWDIFGYFQKSFVRTIWEWKVGTDEELQLIADMKSRRSQFRVDEANEIRFYCKLECKLGAQVFDKLLKNTRALGLSLRRYDGAGSVASAMLRKHNIQAYMHQTQNRLPDEVIKSGYYGGRFDITAFGECGDAIEYDINSAYPYQAMHLPCLSCGEWSYRTEYEESSWSIWYVEWNIPESALWSPFPYRHKHGIYYLRNGSGWYWGNEVREALRLYPDSIRVAKGYLFTKGCEHVPFKFVADYYEKRRKLKLAGDLGQMIIKLGLNSLYGKLAQNVGRKDQAPQTQCLIWAGLITSNTRAMLLSQIRADPDACLLLATDAVVRKSEVTDIETGNDLGQWEPIYLQKLFIVCNGLYVAGRSGEIKHATRGFSSRDFYDEEHGINHWRKIRETAAKQDRFKYDIEVTNFITLGDALDRNPPLTNWRRWITSTKTINYGNFKHKVYRDGRLYPGENEWYPEPSEPFNPEHYRADFAPVVDNLGDGGVQSLEEAGIDEVLDLLH